MRKKVAMILILGMAFAALSTFAQESGDTVRSHLNSAIKEKRDQLQDILETERTKLHNEAKIKIDALKGAASTTEKSQLKEELRARRAVLQEKTQTLRQNLKDNAKELRDNFKEKVREMKDRVKIAAAHGKGLRMLNRFRSAIVRFDHILTRLESRVEKLKARGIDVSSVTPLIEEAKNMKVENAAKLEELKAKYESLLEGDNPRGIGEQARLIAQELKAETEKLHNKLKEIVSAIKAVQPEDGEATSTSAE